MKLSINDFFSKCDKIFTFTEEILNGKLRFLCSLYRKYQKTKKVIFLDWKESDVRGRDYLSISEKNGDFGNLIW